MANSWKSCSTLNLDHENIFNYLKEQKIVMASPDICFTLGPIHSDRQR